MAADYNVDGVTALLAAIFQGDTAGIDTPEQIDLCLHCDRRDCRRGHCGLVNDKGIDTGTIDGGKAHYLHGRRVTASELADMCYVSTDRIYHRLRRGDTPDEIYNYYTSKRGA